MHTYPFHIGDYMKSTSHLTNEQDLAYRRMIDIYYQHERPLEPNPVKLARLTKVSIEAVEVVLEDFFYLGEDGLYHNRRCDEELDNYRRRLELASRAGKASAMKRSTTVQQPFNGRSTSVQPTNNQEPITNMPPLSPIGDIPPISGEQPFNGRSTGVGAKSPTTSEEGGDNIMPLKNRKRATEAKIESVARPANVSEQVWQDFLILRKEKRAPVTETALDGFRREAEKAGVTLEEALMVSVTNGWQGFRADWYVRSGKEGKVKVDSCRSAGPKGKYDHIGKEE